MKKLAIAMIGMMIGISIGWIASPGSYRYWYETKRSMQIVDDNGDILCEIPSQVLLLSSQPLHEKGDLGWWCFVPVYLGTESEADELVQKTKRKLESINDIALSGQIPKE